MLCSQSRQVVNHRCRTLKASPTPDAELSPDDLIHQLAAEHGLRVVVPHRRREVWGTEQEEWEVDAEDEDEDESWEDVVADLGNPWDMQPGRVGLMDDDDGGGLPGAPGAPASGSIAATTAAPNAGPSPSASPYLDTAALRRIGRRELMELAGGAAAAAGGPGPAAAATGGEVGGGGDRASSGEALAAAAAGPGAPGKGRLVLLDVREEAEAEEAGSGVAAGAAAAAASLGLSPRRSPALVSAAAALPLVRLPLSALRRPQAEALSSAWEVLAVLAAAPGDVRSEQAVVRLTKVYGLRRVVLYDDGME